MRLPLHPHHLRTLLPKLANDPHRNFLTFLNYNWVRNMAVQALKRLIVYFNFQGFFRFLFGAVFGQVVQSFFPFVELVFVAAAEEDLYNHKIVAVVVDHPVGDVAQSSSYFLFEPLDLSIGYFNSLLRSLLKTISPTSNP